MTLRFFKSFILVNIFRILTNLFPTFIRFFSKNIGYSHGNTTGEWSDRYQLDSWTVGHLESSPKYVNRCWMGMTYTDWSTYVMAHISIFGRCTATSVLIEWYVTWTWSPISHSYQPQTVLSHSLILRLLIHWPLQRMVICDLRNT